jgi:hypothetical protein
MAKFGSRKAKKKTGRKKAKKSGGGKKSNAWRQYVSGGVSNAPLPD